MPLDRVSAQRKQRHWVREQCAHPRAMAVAATQDSVLLSDSGQQRLLRLPPGGERADAAEDPVLLGLEDGAPLFALDLEAGGGGPADRGSLCPLRDAGTLLPAPEAGLAAYLVALLNWHRRHRFCANCGSPTAVAEGGYTRACPRCGATHFPRVDPVVIMVVSHGDRLLLGRQPTWPQGRYSALAGFVAPGETLEEAIVREVWEESGIAAHDPTFIASQPWPFPSSLMLGFHAQADDGLPVPRDGELEHARWFTAREVRAALAGDPAAPFQAPPPVAIARVLLEHWAAATPGDDRQPAVR